MLRATESTTHTITPAPFDNHGQGMPQRLIQSPVLGAAAFLRTVAVAIAVAAHVAEHASQLQCLKPHYPPTVRIVGARFSVSWELVLVYRGSSF